MLLKNILITSPFLIFLKRTSRVNVGKHFLLETVKKISFESLKENISDLSVSDYVEKILAIFYESENLQI